MVIKRIGVVGAGAMGSGIAQVVAQSGYEVTISDISNALVEKGLAAITKSLNKSIEKGRLSPPEKEFILGRIKGTGETKDFAECDLIVEAVPEIPEVKKNIFRELDKVCPQHTIMASNTSSLSVIGIAAVTKRLDKVLGLHFFNPPPIMKLLEIVKTIATSEETLQMCTDFGTSLGKTVVIAKDTPGFIVNRLNIPYTLNAIRMLESGIATREDIDSAVVNGLNYPMGPLALADFLGVDTLYDIACDMYDKTKDPQFAPPVLLQKMYSARWFGRKTCRGFYEYNK